MASWWCAVLVASAVLGMVSVALSAAPKGDPWRPYTQDLAGPWDILPGHATEEMFKPEAAAKATTWGTVPVPGLWPQARGVEAALAGRPWPEVESVWYRRRFDVPVEARYRRAVLRLAAVRWGSTVWLNGREVGGHLGAFRVTDLDVTDALKPGEANELVLRLIGWPAIPRSAKDQQYLIPAGSAPHSWGLKVGGVAEGITLHYCDETYIRSARIQADQKTGAVALRVRFRNYGLNYGLIEAQVEVLRQGRPVAQARKAFGRFISLDAKREDQWLDLETKVPSPALWSPEAPNLYEARITLLHDGRVADVWTDRFGFRTFEVKDRAFHLNGRRIFLRGTNLWGEYVGGRARFPDRAAIRRYLREVPALFHGNCIRGHSIPFTKEWLEAADEAGALLVQEFPLTVNYDTFEFTPEELATFKRNVESEYATMIEYYWNHPSIIMWAPTNESPRWEDWENGALYRLFKEADPTRPVIRAGRVSPDVYDTHCYDGWWQGADGDFDQMMAESAEKACLAGLPFTNTEYIENSNKRRAYRFLGPKLDTLVPEALQKALEDLRAEVTAEQSECLRRLGAQLILHYAGLQVRNWQDPENLGPTPSFYALKNAFAPVGVSIDLFNRHFEAGTTVTVPVHVMNDRETEATGDLEVALLKAEPPFSWDGTIPREAAWKAEARSLRALRVPAFDRKVLEVPVPVPAGDGRYTLVAVWRATGPEAVHSRRPVFAVTPVPPTTLSGKAVAVFEAEVPVKPWLGAHGARIAGLAEARVALVGPDIHRSPAFAAAVPELRQWVEAGGRLVILEQSHWVYDGLVKMETPFLGRRGGISTVFRKDRPDDPMWRNVPEDLMRRWTGLPGAIARYTLKTGLKHEVLAVGTDQTEFPQTVVAASVAVGRGRVVFCQFKIAERLDRSSPMFDPVAERVLANLVAGEPPPR